MEPLSFNAQVARSGNSAEAIVCQNKHLFTSYFQKTVCEASLIPGRKKSDILLRFEDGTLVRIQNKNGTGGGRGWSVDRRDVNHLPLEEIGKTLVRNVCLKKGSERPECCQPQTLLRTLLLGTDEQYIPTYFTHSVIDKTTGELKELSICSTEALIEALANELYPNFIPKKTCVHLSPRMYMQRKGGGSKDHAPDNIQAKLKSLPPILSPLLPQTIVPPVAQTPSTQ